MKCGVTRRSPPSSELGMGRLGRGVCHRCVLRRVLPQLRQGQGRELALALGRLSVLRRCLTVCTMHRLPAVVVLMWCCVGRSSVWWHVRSDRERVLRVVWAQWRCVPFGVQKVDFSSRCLGCDLSTTSWTDNSGAPKPAATPTRTRVAAASAILRGLAVVRLVSHSRRAQQ